MKEEAERSPCLCSFVPNICLKRKWIKRKCDRFRRVSLLWITALIDNENGNLTAEITLCCTPTWITLNTIWYVCVCVVMYQSQEQIEEERERVNASMLTLEEELESCRDQGEQWRTELEVTTQELHNTRAESVSPTSTFIMVFIAPHRNKQQMTWKKKSTSTTFVRCSAAHIKPATKNMYWWDNSHWWVYNFKDREDHVIM